MIFQGKLRASTLVDLFAGLDWPKWNIEAFVTNVFDVRDDHQSSDGMRAAARGLWSCPDGRGRSAFARAYKF